MASASQDYEEESRLVFSLKDMRELQMKFAEEAFSYLKKNSEIWIEFPKDFLLWQDISMCCGTFTQDVVKSVLVVAVSLHVMYKKTTRVMFHTIKTETDYENYILSYKVTQNESYFYNFLSWVSFMFDFTSHCYKEGLDFYDIGRKVLAKYPYVEYFHARGGWGKLLELCTYMGALFDRMIRFLSYDEPFDEVILNFMKTAEILERSNKRGSTKIAPQMRYLRQIRRNLFKDDFMPNPARITTGVKVVLNKKSAKGKSLKEVCPQAAELLEKHGVRPKNERIVSDVTEQLEKTSLCVKPEQTSPEKDNGSSPNIAKSTDVSKAADIAKSTDVSKSPTASTIKKKAPVFIINERFLEKRNTEKDSLQIKDKRGLKIFSPSKQIDILSMDLSEILEENIEKKNFDKIGLDMYAVYPPGCDIHDDETRVIVLDSSSEDETDDDVVLVGRQIEELVKSIYARHRAQSCCKPLFPETFNVTKESISKSEEFAKQQQCTPTKITGAIPKIKVHPLDEVSPIGYKHSIPSIDELQATTLKDLTVSGEQKTKSKKSRRRKKKSKH